MNPLSDIRQYNPNMTISQVMKFCEKKGMNITRAMIQNYIRDGLMPSPVNKRFYTHNHLAALALIDKLKTVFEISAIKEALTPFLDNEGIPLETYTTLIEKAGELTHEILSQKQESGTLATMLCAAGIKEGVGMPV